MIVNGTVSNKGAWTGGVTFGRKNLIRSDNELERFK